MPNETLDLFEEIKKGFQETIDLGRRATSELGRFRSAASRAFAIGAGPGVTSAFYGMDVKDYGLRRAVSDNLQFNTGMEWGGRAAAKVFPKRAQGITNWTSEIKQLDEAMKALERSSTVVGRSLANVTKVLRFAAGPVGQTIAVATLAYDQFIDRAIKKYEEFEKVRTRSVQKFEEVARRERQLGYSITGRLDSGARTAYLDYASRAGISTTGLNRLSYLRAAGDAGLRGLNVRESDLAIRYGTAIARETGKEVSRAIRDSMREIALAGVTRSPESVETRIARRALNSGVSLAYRGTPTIGQRWDTYFQERGREISRAFETPYGFNLNEANQRIIADVLGSIPGLRTLNLGRASTGGFQRVLSRIGGALVTPVSYPLGKVGEAATRGLEIAGQYKDRADVAIGRWAVSHLGDTPYEKFLKDQQKTREQILNLKNKRIEREKKLNVVEERLQPWKKSIDDYTNRYLAADAAERLQRIEIENSSKRNQIAQLESQLETGNFSKADMIKMRKKITGLRNEIGDNNERSDEYNRVLKNSGISSDVAFKLIPDRDKIKSAVDRNKKRYEEFREKEILKYSQALPERRDFNLFDYIGVYDSSKIQERRRTGIPQDVEARDFLKRIGIETEKGKSPIDQAREVRSIMAQEAFFKASEETKERVAKTYIESARLSGRYKGVEAVKILAPQLVKLGEGKNLLREYINIAGPEAINRIADKYNFTGNIDEKRRKIIERAEKGDDIQRRNMAYDISEVLKGEGTGTLRRLGGATTRAVGEVYRLGQNVGAIRPAEDIIAQQLINRVNLGQIAGKRFEETRQFPYLTQRGQTLGFLTGEEAARFGTIGREDEMTRNQVKNILSIKERAFQQEIEFTKQYTQARMNVIQEHYDRAIKTEQLRLEGRDRRFAPQLQYGQQIFGLSQAAAGAITSQFSGEDYRRAIYRQGRGLREQRTFLTLGAAGVNLPPIARFGLALRSQQEQEEDFRRAIARQRLQDQLQIRSVRGTLGSLAAQGTGVNQLQQTEGGLALLSQMFQSTQGAYSRQGINTLPIILGLLGRQRQFAARRLGLQLQERGLRTRMFEDQINVLEQGGEGLTGRAADIYRAQTAGKYKEAADYFASIGDVGRYKEFSEKFEKAYSMLPEQLKTAFEDQQKLTNLELQEQTKILEAIRQNTGGLIEGFGGKAAEKGKGTVGKLKNITPMENRIIGGKMLSFPQDRGNHPFDVGSWRSPSVLSGGIGFNITPRTPGSEGYNYEKAVMDWGNLKLSSIGPQGLVNPLPIEATTGNVSLDEPVNIPLGKNRLEVQRMIALNPGMADKAWDRLQRGLGVKRRRDLRESYAQELESLGWKRSTDKFIRPDGTSYAEDTFIKGGKSMHFNQDQLLKAAQTWSSGITDSPSIQDEFKTLSPEDKNADTVEKFGQYVKDFGEKNIHITVNDRGTTASSSSVGGYGFKQ